MLNQTDICSLRMRRQHLSSSAGTAEYDELYRDTQPGQNVYWNGFGDPPSLAFRADFDDMEYNRRRQRTRQLVKGRFAGGNLGWIVREDMELFACLYRKPLDRLSDKQRALYTLIEREGPLNIQQMKEVTGMLFKEITPGLHRLQEAFLLYEDQYDGEWDRCWYRFSESFPAVDLTRYSRVEALKILLLRYARRLVHVTLDMAKNFYRVPAKELKLAAEELCAEGELTPWEDGYLLTEDRALLEKEDFSLCQSVYVLHRNDILVKSFEPLLKTVWPNPDKAADNLYYILVDGDFHGVVKGHFKNGPYLLEDVRLDLPDDVIFRRRDEVIEAVYRVNDRELSPLPRFMGEKLA